MIGRGIPSSQSSSPRPITSSCVDLAQIGTITGSADESSVEVLGYPGSRAGAKPTDLKRALAAVPVRNAINARAGSTAALLDGMAAV